MYDALQTAVTELFHFRRNFQSQKKSSGMSKGGDGNRRRSSKAFEYIHEFANHARKFTLGSRSWKENASANNKEKVQFTLQNVQKCSLLFHSSHLKIVVIFIKRPFHKLYKVNIFKFKRLTLLTFSNCYLLFLQFWRLRKRICKAVLSEIKKISE